MKTFMIIWLGIILASCSHQSADQTYSTNRQIASDPAAQVWVDHPCRVSGAPFKKYHSFSLKDGVLYGRGSPESEPKEIKEKKKGGASWASVEEFFQAKVPCAGGPVAPAKPDANDGGDSDHGDNNEPPSGHEFVEPIHNSFLRYYNGFWTKLKNLQEKRVGPNNVKVNSDPNLTKRLLGLWIAMPRKQKDGENDSPVTQCSKIAEANAKCIQQKEYSYENARSVMFGDLDQRVLPNGELAVMDYYCQRPIPYTELTQLPLEEVKKIEPLNIYKHIYKDNVNIEHGWPQSKFVPGKTNMQKTDYHHIQPTDKVVNNERGNLDFAEVVRATAKAQKCGDSLKGDAMPVEGVVMSDAEKKVKYFEPPTSYKGNLARGLMYFSVRYNAGMSPIQEYYLRKWHREDPVDSVERDRAEKIYKMIGVRNPFVDYADMVDKVKRFCRVKMSPTQPAGSYDCP